MADRACAVAADRITLIVVPVGVGVTAFAEHEQRRVVPAGVELTVPGRLRSRTADMLEAIDELEARIAGIVERRPRIRGEDRHAVASPVAQTPHGRPSGVSPFGQIRTLTDPPP